MPRTHPPCSFGIALTPDDAEVGDGHVIDEELPYRPGLSRVVLAR